MYAWLTPWLYLLVVGCCYYFGGGSGRPRAWVLSHRNVWLMLALSLVILGIASAIFWTARLVHLISWLVFVGVSAWTIRSAWQFKPEDLTSGLPDDEP